MMSSFALMLNRIAVGLSIVYGVSIKKARIRFLLEFQG